MVTVVERCGDMKTVPSTISTLYPSGTGIRSSASNIASRVRSLSLSAISILSVGKPAPDLFLHAARSLGVEPGRARAAQAVRRDGSTTETRLPSRARTPMAARPRAPRWTTVSQVSGRP